MINSIVFAVAAILFLATLLKAATWRKAYLAAQTTNFPVFLSPVHIRDIWWLALHQLLVPLLNRMPKSWTHPWLQMGQVFKIWKTGYEPFESVGSDSFVLSAPQGNMLWTCDPKLIHQLEASYPQFQKAVEMLRFLDIWGPTVASVEGQAWRVHHRAVMSGFTPATNAAVWKETTQQTKALIDRWADKHNYVVPSMRKWTKRLTLHVVAEVFFRKTILWSSADEEKGEGKEFDVPAGYAISFEKALFTILERLGVLLMTPRVLLRNLPFKSVQETNLAFNEFTKYLQDLIRQAKAQREEVASRKNRSMLESIVLAGSENETPFSENDILGNLFFVLSAGHETVANTMAFTLALLAIYPEHQARIQQDLSNLLAIRPQEEWTSEREYQALQHGYMGAVVKEVMRLYCVVEWLPRVTKAALEVTDSKGQSHVVPEDTMVILNFSAAFLNPKTWPPRPMSEARRAELHFSPAADFDPSRWLGGNDRSAVGEDGKSLLLHFPFGQGAHACPGRYFAQVEMTAFLATLLVEHSLELVVDDETKRSCSGDLQLAWEKTRDGAIRMLKDDVVTNQNLELHKDLPMRLVKS